MTLTKRELSLVVEDLAGLLPGLRVGKVFELGRDRVALDLGRQGFLVLSGAPRTGRLHLADRIRKIGSCSALCALLRKHLTGAVIVDLSVWSDDRVVEIRFGRQVTLLLFVYGKGYALLDEQRRLLGASASCFLSPGDVVDPAAEPAGHSRTKSDGVGPHANSDGDNGASQVQRDRFSGRGRPLHLRIDAVYRDIEERILREETLRRLSKELRARKKKLLRLRLHLERDLARREIAEDKQRRADLLLANEVSQHRGADHVVVRDWFQSGQEITISLDPRYTIFENAQRWYKQARRDRRAAEMAADRLVSVEAGIERIDALLGELDDGSAGSDINAFEERVRQVLGSKRPPREKSTASNPARKRARGGLDAPGKGFVSVSGLEIRVGGGAEENHRLTFHWARGRDMWFHVAGRSGPHVVVRADHKGGVDSQTLLDAATLALFYVDKNRQAEGEVLYQRCKHLRPVKGAPGRVVTAGAKTIFLRVDEDRLSRLLSQRG